MRVILDIARNDLRIIFSDRSIFINLIVVPLVLAYVIGLANAPSSAGGGPKLLVDAINSDSGTISQDFFTGLREANASIVLCPQDNDATDVCQLKGATLDEALSVQRLKAQTSLALIEIPASFTDDVNAGKDVTIVYRSNEDASAPSYILQAVQAETQRLGGALIASKVGSDIAAKSLNINDPKLTDDIRQKATTLWAQNPIQVQYVIAQQPQTGDQSSNAGFKQSIPGIGTMYVMFIIFPAAAAIIAERKNWTLQRMASLPISRAQILGGKLLARFATGMLEYAIVFVFGYALGVRYGGDPVAILLLAVTFTLAVTALTLALTTILHNSGQARGIGLFLTLTFAPLGGAWWPLDIVPQFMRAAGHISPVAWVMDGFTTVVINGGHLGDVLLPLAVLVVMTIVFFAYGVARFKFTD